MDPAAASLFALAGLLVGALAGWVLATLRRSRLAERAALAEGLATAERDRRTAVEAELAAERQRGAALARDLAVAEERAARAQEQIAEQRRFLEEARRELEDAFKALAAAALQGTTEQFLALAEQKLATTRAEATAALDERKTAIETLLAPLQTTLARLDEKTAALESSRTAAYARLDEQVRQLASATAALQQGTTSLASALRGSSQARGRWGEVTLRNIADLSGMTEHCDFEEQVGQSDGGRPDMVVHLPGGGRIAVDAKAPLAAYLDAAETSDEAQRKAALQRHARDLRGHVKALAERDYAAQVGGPVDIVVLFLPGDPYLGAAFAQDPELQTWALRSRVLIATPTTLVALLRTVALYWQQKSVVENADAIADAARELYDRVAVFEEHLHGVGGGLKRAIGAYNSAVGSFERKVFPMARRLEELKAGGGAKRQLGLLEPIDETPRGLDDD